LILVMDIREEGLQNSGKKVLWRSFLVFFGVLLVFLFLLIRVWLPSKAVEIAIEIGKLEDQKRALEEENLKLALEITKLKAPERIEKIATTELNMIRSPEIEVIVLEKNYEITNTNH
jgi:cell division protein FtsL